MHADSCDAPPCRAGLPRWDADRDDDEDDEAYEARRKRTGIKYCFRWAVHPRWEEGPG